MSAENKVPAIRFKGFSGEWEEGKFKDIVANLSGGASIAPSDYQDNGKRTIPKGAVNATGVADLSGSKYISIDFFQKNILSKVSSGDLVTSLRDLVPTAPNMGRVVKINLPQEDFLMPQGVYKIELEKDVDENFVITYSNSEVFRKIIAREKNGSTQVHIRNGEFLDIEIIRPKPEEQTKVGNFFQQLDTLIAQHQQKHDKLLNLKRALLEKLFPQRGQTQPAIRFKGFSGEWEEKALDKITDVRDGTHDSPQYKTKGYPFVTSKNVKNGYINYDDVQYISKIDYDEINKRSKVDLNDILMGMIGTIGNIALIREEPDFAIKNVALIKDKKLVNYLYVYYFLQAPVTLQQLEDGVDGGTQKFVSLSNIRNLLIQLPNSSEQTKIGQLFQQLDTLISQHQAQLSKLGNIKQACLAKMFV